MRQEVYRVALDEAKAELNEILARFEQLRLRKDRIEKIVEALKPLVVSNEVSSSTMVLTQERSVFESDRPVSVSDVAQPADRAIAVQEVAEASSYSAQQVDEVADPFARRGESVAGSSASRDVREYSRLFNSSTSHSN